MKYVAKSSIKPIHIVEAEEAENREEPKKKKYKKKAQA